MNKKFGIKGELAFYRTKLANQRTYLAYMRTGFGIAALAGTFKKYWIMLFGLFMIIMSSLQYIYINYSVSETKVPHNKMFDLLPIIYVLLSCGALYLQFKRKKSR